MQVTFGTRTAIRDLHTVMEQGEQVVDMVRCQFSSGNAVLVLSDRRVIAVRDDYSAYRLKAVRLEDVKAVDYAPKVHDGLGVLTEAGRIAVRRMNRSDSDRLVDGLLLRAPTAVLGVSRPSPRDGRPVFEPGANAEPAPVAFQTDSPQDNGTYEAVPAAAPATPAPPAGEPRTLPPTDTSSIPSDEQLTRAADTDQAVLMSVLADLHARGLLTAEELAAKIAQLTVD